MVQIKQVLLTDNKEKQTYEQVNHKEAFEYIPTAKGESYTSLSGDNKAILLIIKLLSCDKNDAERDIISSNLYSKAMAYVRKVLMKYTDDFTVLSISHIRGSANLNDGLVINALLAPESEAELSEKTIFELIDEIKKEIDSGIVPLHKIQMNENTDENTNKTLNIQSSSVADIQEYASDEREKNEPAETPEISEKQIIKRFANKITSIAFLNSFAESISIESADSSLMTDGNLTVLENNDNDIEQKKLAENETALNVEYSPTDNDLNALKGQEAQMENETVNSDLEKKDDRGVGEPSTSFSFNKDNSDYNEKGFIATFFDGDTCVDNVQAEAYKNASPKQPFLNSISKYTPSMDINTLEQDASYFDIYEEDEFIETTSSKEKIRTSFNQAMRYFMENERTMMKRTLRGEVEQKKFMDTIKGYVDRYLKIPEEDMEMFMNKLERAFFSYYVLTPAIKNPEVSDIKVLAPDNVNIKIHGTHYIASGLKFIDENDYIRFIDGLIIRNKISINNPIIVFTDKDYNPDYILRFNLCLPVINSSGMPYLHIRKIPKKKTSLKSLIEAGMLDEKIAAYLLDKVATSRGIVFAGPSASGKTTLMNALLDYIPKDKSVLCIQESEELFSNIHPNVYFQHMLKNSRGQTVIGLSELGQNGLLCDSGYFIIGECKGAEVRDLLRASNTGHKCWCSVHSQSSRETIPRLADYVKYGSDYSLTEATRMLKDLETIVYIEGFKITEISEIAGYNEKEEKIIYKPIYKKAFDNA